MWSPLSVRMVQDICKLIVDQSRNPMYGWVQHLKGYGFIDEQ